MSKTKNQYTASILVVDRKGAERWSEVVVVADDWWEARKAAVKQLKLTSDTVFSPGLSVSRKK